MEEKVAVDWPAIRRAYEESDVPVDKVAAAHGLHRVTIYARAKAEGWKPRAAVEAQRLRRAREREPTDVARLVEALQRATARLVTSMEARLGTAEGLDEKDARTLGALATALAKVIALNPDPRSSRDGHAPDGDHLAQFDAVAAFEALSRRVERHVAERAAGFLGSADPAGAAGDGPSLAAVREGGPAAADR